jgi:hypothetical protein
VIFEILDDASILELSLSCKTMFAHVLESLEFTSEYGLLKETIPSLCVLDFLRYRIARSKDKIVYTDDAVYMWRACKRSTASIWKYQNLHVVVLKSIKKHANLETLKMRNAIRTQRQLKRDAEIALRFKELHKLDGYTLFRAYAKATRNVALWHKRNKYAYTGNSRDLHKITSMTNRFKKLSFELESKGIKLNPNSEMCSQYILCEKHTIPQILNKLDSVSDEKG